MRSAVSLGTVQLYIGIFSAEIKLLGEHCRYRQKGKVASVWLPSNLMVG